jgi:nicotinamide-nucleotide amidase
VSLFPDDITNSAARLLEDCRRRGITLATAESCTGGLLAAGLTSIAGSSDVFERGFVTYSNQSKMELLGVSSSTLEAHGAVSPETAIEMADGLLRNSAASIGISITGIAGPAGGGADKPVGLVHMAVSWRSGTTAHQEFRFGPRSRSEIQIEAARAALGLLARSAADR